MMSFDAENQNPTHHAPSTISDTKGKGKGDECNIFIPYVEKSANILGGYPFEKVPSPACHVLWDAQGEYVATPATAAPIDPLLIDIEAPLMKLTNSPPPHLADGPMWCAQMVGNEDDYYIHLADKLELAKIEDADALAEVRIARVELMSEMGQTQDVLDQATIVAGKDFVQKMTRTVQWLMETGDWDLDEESEEQEQYVGDGNSCDGDDEREEGEQDEECGYWSGEDYECEDYQQYEEHEWSGGSVEEYQSDIEDEWYSRPLADPFWGPTTVHEPSVLFTSEQLLQDAEDAEDEFRSGSAGEGEEYPQAMEGDALSLRGLKRV